MYLLPGNPFSQAVEAYRDSGEALCSKGMHAVPPPFEITGNIGAQGRRIARIVNEAQVGDR